VSGVVRLAGAAALGLAAATAVAPNAARSRLRLVVRPAGAAAAARSSKATRGSARAVGRPVGAALVVAAVVSALVLAGALAGPVGVLAVTAYGAAGWWALRKRARARADAATRAAGAVALAGLADDLRAGQTPLTALHTAMLALEPEPAIAPVRAALAAARVGLVRTPHPSGSSRSGASSGWPHSSGGEGADGDLVGALRAVSGPLAPALRRLAAAWALTDIGIPLAEVVDRLDVELRLQRRAADRVEAHTASARMTARLVACLPVLGLGIGQLLGASPFEVLTRERAGAACAAVAIVLHLVGFAWASRLGRVVAR
jgi:tight adherence protein B